MSRNGLLDLLRLSYKTAQISQQLETSTAEAQGWLNERLSRRRLLQSSSVLAGAIALNTAFPSIARAQPIPKVLIVGAGIAGLTAAYRLHQAGVPIDIVEASHRVGGRMSSLTNVPDAPGVVELGGEFIDSAHVHIRSIAAELNLEMADLRSADRGLIPEVFYIRGNHVSHRTIAEEFKPLAAQILRDLESIAPDEKITYHHPSPAAMRLDRLSLADYLDSTSISPTLRELIRVAYVTEMGMEIEEQSCLNLLFLIGTEIGGWSTYGISDERYHVIGGNDRIPRALADRLSPYIETGTVLESIRARADGGYRVSLRQDGINQARTYDRILLTVPFPVLRQIDLAVEMSPVKRRSIDQLGYGTSSKLAVPFQERLWRSRYGSTASIYSDLPFQNTWESARYQSSPTAWLTDLRGGQAGIELGAGDPESHAQLLSRQLDSIFPGLEQVDRGRAVRAFWAGEPYQQGSYSAYRVGQWTSIGGAEGERIGNIWFAGEHCSYAAQGYMDGACETGEYAALGILEDLGLPTAAQAARLEHLRRSRSISRPTVEST
ncbi:FAD-dependent oxidoreductase [Microcoleus sp. FACHB-1515]|uniref:NAD(P)/FAD-dependent oxidoreductase n=1 Tax=Cyanophyceae TaxID=3028117 RepID=UPI0016849FBB|nr:NAD(P)/FAD-dependent oxidoreductase [Microcoleus sp. FACHB-1515]MBD2090262.1 FAD-dependent oxidoreductase [Microcoleus sp. FACHB-1515]